jgi:magnesium-transporting ATPase (P-type)
MRKIKELIIQLLTLIGFLNRNVKVIKVEVTSSPLPLDEELLTEWAKSLVSSSIAVSADFHKTMLGLTATFTTLMAGTIGLLILGKTGADLSISRWRLIIPTLLMLLSSITFCAGYYPRRVHDVPPQDIERIRQIRTSIVNRRFVWAIMGCFFFISSITAFCVVTILGDPSARQQRRPAPHQPTETASEQTLLVTSQLSTFP